MKSLLRPLLFVDEDKAEGAASLVGPTQRSETGKRKNRRRQTLAGGQPLHSFEDFLEHLAGLTVAESELEVVPEQRVAVVSALTPLQRRAFKALGVQPQPAPLAERLTAREAGT